MSPVGVAPPSATERARSRTVRLPSRRRWRRGRSRSRSCTDHAPRRSRSGRADQSARGRAPERRAGRAPRLLLALATPKLRSSVRGPATPKPRSGVGGSSEEAHRSHVHGLRQDPECARGDQRRRPPARVPTRGQVATADHAARSHAPEPSSPPRREPRIQAESETRFPAAAQPSPRPGRRAALDRMRRWRRFAPQAQQSGFP